MDNKPIIIAGIDVSECEQITCKDSLNPMCGNTGICCYGIQNCYFKHLTRKTQECEKLKNEIEACYNQVEDFDIIATSKSNKLKQAEQKLEKIKQIVNKLSLSIN